MYKNTLMMCLFAFVGMQVFAQGTVATTNGLDAIESNQTQTVLCVSDEYLSQQMTMDPGMAERMAAIEAHTEAYIQGLEQSGADGAQERGSAVVITLPVVFHVLYQGATENISDAQIMSQLDRLNLDFRLLNPDIASAEPEFAPLAADFEIEFCMADVDPNGNPTNGITRTATTVNKFNPLNDNVKKSAMGGKSPWPSDDYLNIWVCDLDDIYLGYATFPGGSPLLDGVVVDHITVGQMIGTATAPYDLGRALVHEIGHWLNLQHIWGNCLIPFFGCCDIDDQVADTPVQNGSSSGCPLSQVSCGSKDNVQNHMDYTDDACSVMFTQGQKNRARSLFSPGGVREVMLSSGGCSAGPVVCDVPANLGMTLSPPTNGVASWDAVADANNYTLEGCKVGGPCSFFTAGSNSVSYSGFKGATDYEFRVKANCDAGLSSAYSPWFGFTTPGARAGSNGGNTIKLFPNPAGSMLQLEFAPLAAAAQVSVTDLSGRELIAPIALQGGASQLSVETSSLQNGVYLLRFEMTGGSNNSSLQVERFSILK